MKVLNACFDAILLSAAVVMPINTDFFFPANRVKAGKKKSGNNNKNQSHKISKITSKPNTSMQKIVGKSAVLLLFLSALFLLIDGVSAASDVSLDEVVTVRLSDAEINSNSIRYSVDFDGQFITRTANKAGDYFIDRFVLKNKQSAVNSFFSNFLNLFRTTGYTTHEIHDVVRIPVGTKQLKFIYKNVVIEVNVVEKTPAEEALPAEEVPLPVEMPIVEVPLTEVPIVEESVEEVSPEVSLPEVVPVVTPSEDVVPFIEEVSPVAVAPPEELPVEEIVVPILEEIVQPTEEMPSELPAEVPSELVVEEVVVSPEELRSVEEIVTEVTPEEVIAPLEEAPSEISVEEVVEPTVLQVSLTCSQSLVEELTENPVLIDGVSIPVRKLIVERTDTGERIIDQALNRCDSANIVINERTCALELLDVDKTILEQAISEENHYRFLEEQGLLSEAVVINCETEGNYCGYENGAAVCISPTCSDELKNQDETDIDCGGICEVKCESGKSCISDADCSSDICENNMCVEPEIIEEQILAVEQSVAEEPVTAEDIISAADIPEGSTAEEQWEGLKQAVPQIFEEIEWTQPLPAQTVELDQGQSNLFESLWKSFHPEEYDISPIPEENVIAIAPGDNLELFVTNIPESISSVTVRISWGSNGELITKTHEAVCGEGKCSIFVSIGQNQEQNQNSITGSFFNAVTGFLIINEELPSDREVIVEFINPQTNNPFQVFILSPFKTGQPTAQQLESFEREGAGTISAPQATSESIIDLQDKLAGYQTAETTTAPLPFTPAKITYPPDAELQQVKSGFCAPVLYSGPTKHKLDIVILGNHPDLEQHAVSLANQNPTVYRETAASMFTKEPFKSNMERFNVWIIPERYTLEVATPSETFSELEWDFSGIFGAAVYSNHLTGYLSIRSIGRDIAHGINDLGHDIQNGIDAVRDELRRFNRRTSAELRRIDRKVVRPLKEGIFRTLLEIYNLERTFDLDKERRFIQLHCPFSDFSQYLTHFRNRELVTGGFADEGLAHTVITGEECITYKDTLRNIDYPVCYTIAGDRNTVLHEFGHTIGNLDDEYIAGEKRILDGKTNCAPHAKSCIRFAGIDPQASCIKGCTKTDYYRAYMTSAMLDSSREFGKINSYFLQQIFDKFIEKEYTPLYQCFRQVQPTRRDIDDKIILVPVDDTFASTDSNCGGAGAEQIRQLGYVSIIPRQDFRQLNSCAFIFNDPVLDDGGESTDQDCEGNKVLGELGYISTVRAEDAVQLYSCLNEVKTDRYSSINIDCEGNTNQGVVGYIFTKIPDEIIPLEPSIQPATSDKVSMHILVKKTTTIDEIDFTNQEVPNAETVQYLKLVIKIPKSLFPNNFVQLQSNDVISIVGEDANGIVYKYDMFWSPKQLVIDADTGVNYYNFITGTLLGNRFKDFFGKISFRVAGTTVDKDNYDHAVPQDVLSQINALTASVDIKDTNNILKVPVMVTRTENAFVLSVPSIQSRLPPITLDWPEKSCTADRGALLHQSVPSAFELPLHVWNYYHGTPFEGTPIHAIPTTLETLNHLKQQFPELWKEEQIQCSSDQHCTEYPDSVPACTPKINIEEFEDTKVKFTLPSCSIEELFVEAEPSEYDVVFRDNDESNDLPRINLEFTRRTADAENTCEYELEIPETVNDQLLQENMLFARFVIGQEYGDADIGTIKIKRVTTKPFIAVKQDQATLGQVAIGQQTRDTEITTPVKINKPIQIIAEIPKQTVDINKLTDGRAVLKGTISENKGGSWDFEADYVGLDLETGLAMFTATFDIPPRITDNWLIELPYTDIAQDGKKTYLVLNFQVRGESETTITAEVLQNEQTKLTAEDGTSIDFEAYCSDKDIIAPRFTIIEFPLFEEEWNYLQSGKYGLATAVLSYLIERERVSGILLGKTTCDFACYEKDGAAKCETCNDNIKNRDETGVDCGGSCQNKCSGGNECTSNADCASNICSEVQFTKDDVGYGYCLERFTITSGAYPVDEPGFYSGVNVVDSDGTAHEVNVCNTDQHIEFVVGAVIEAAGTDDLATKFENNCKRLKHTYVFIVDETKAGTLQHVRVQQKSTGELFDFSGCAEGLMPLYNEIPLITGVEDIAEAPIDLKTNFKCSKPKIKITVQELSEGRIKLNAEDGTSIELVTSNCQDQNIINTDFSSKEFFTYTSDWNNIQGISTSREGVEHQSLILNQLKTIQLTNVELSESTKTCSPYDCYRIGAGEAKCPSCNDNIKNGDEADIDCGGSCSNKCDINRKCFAGSDCSSGICSSDNVCVASLCEDGIKSGSETDVDCGGTCTNKCSNGKSCSIVNDCISSVCRVNICAVPSCDDGVKNGGETDIDCGADCSECEAGKACGSGSDCTSKVCTNGFCAAPSCNDKLKNSDESDVDCGGSYCLKCNTNQACNTNLDCVGGVCISAAMEGGSSKICASASCTDGVKNGGESGVDCGGTSTCGKCDVNQGCTENSDCTSGVCKNNICALPSCYDGVKNGAEAGVDCGKSCKKLCSIDRSCNDELDCYSTVCENNICSSLQLELPAGSEFKFKTSLCESPNWYVVSGGKKYNLKAGQSTVSSGEGYCLYTYPIQSSTTGWPSGANDLHRSPDPFYTGQQAGQNYKTDAYDEIAGKYVLKEATCNDGVKNGGESGVDCGGSCKSCLGDACNLNDQCASNICSTERKYCAKKYTIIKGLYPVPNEAVFTGIEVIDNEGVTHKVDVCGVGAELEFVPGEIIEAAGIDDISDGWFGESRCTRLKKTYVLKVDASINNVPQLMSIIAKSTGNVVLSSRSACGSGYSPLYKGVAFRSGFEFRSESAPSSFSTIPGGITCRFGSCFDGRKNYDESDVDCGGTSCGVKCSINKACSVNTDCASSLCASYRYCAFSYEVISGAYPVEGKIGIYRGVKLKDNAGATHDLLVCGSNQKLLFTTGTVFESDTPENVVYSLEDNCRYI